MRPTRPFAVAAATLVLVWLVGTAPAGAQEAPWDPTFARPSTAADFGVGTRPFGVAAGDYDGDGAVDLVVGRATGNVAFVKGHGDGAFAPPVTFAWKQAALNTWAFAPADVNGDGRLDVVWGASASSPTAEPFSVNDGDVRAFLGNGDGTFQERTYLVSGVVHNAGTLLADVGTDTGSVATGDLDGDGSDEVIVGAVDGADTTVKVLRNDGAGAFAVSTLLSQPTAVSGDAASPTYWPAISTQNSPWGLAIGDADGDGDGDLFVGDRALYVYLYLNDGTGALTLRTPNSAIPGRPNVYLRHDTYRPDVGYTPALAAGDLNGDGRADLALGLLASARTPAAGIPHDGEVLVDLSTADGHSLGGVVADVGAQARGLAMADVDGDGARDLVSGSYDGAVSILRQLPPLDGDGDGLSDYIDNAPTVANAPRLDMNVDGALNQLDQLDNDFDTVLGDPADPTTWRRLGDPADPDDDDDGVADDGDNCVYRANPDQTDRDGDGRGDACDPLDDRDPDGDAVPTGYLPGDPFHDAARSAAARWSTAGTHFVIRIDALGRLFQNEFTQLLTDGATLSPGEWAAKCWEDYGPGDPPDPCGTGEGSPDQTVTLAGGREVPLTLITIPRQLWTDPPVIDWINDRNDSPRLDIGQHATYHANNTPVGDWKDDPSRNYFSCETCGLSPAENAELLRIGYDTLVGNYDNRWLVESGATPSSPRIDWSHSANPLISYSPPYNASDAASREATAQLGFRSFSASRFEEDPAYLGGVFSPEGNWHERFDPTGMFHASADWQIDPEDLEMSDDEYTAYLASRTEPGGLNTWLIEEVEWSGRADDNAPRALDNREDNTVHPPRWARWLQLLDFVRTYPDAVVVTQGEVALARGYDNAPTVANPDQADTDHDGTGDAIDGARLDLTTTALDRHRPAALTARLVNGAGVPVAGQTVTFTFDADGDGVAEAYVAVTGDTGDASAPVTTTRPVGPAAYSASWDGVRTSATATSNFTVTREDTVLTLITTPGKWGEPATATATLREADGAPLPGRTVTLAAVVRNHGRDRWVRITDVSTDDSGQATAPIPRSLPRGRLVEIRALFPGDDGFAPAAARATLR